MKVTRLNNSAEFEAMRHEWEHLVAQTSDVSIFQTWDWQCLWWKHYGAGKELYLLKAEDRAGKLTGILPMHIAHERVFFLFRVRLLRPIGTGGDTAPDYLGPIVPAGAEAEVNRAFLDYLLQHQADWDRLFLSDITHSSQFLAQLRGWQGGASWQCEDAEPTRISFINLPASWDDYLASFGRDRRYTVRSTRRRFLSQEGARFFVVNKAEEFDAIFDQLVNLHRARWATKGEEHSFSSTKYNNFHREVMRQCMVKGWLRLYCMELNGKIIAIYYCYSWRGTTYYFQGGFDPQYEKLRPGLCLMGFAIESAIAEGQHCFDMLRGEYEYKKQWAKDVRTTHCRSFARPGLTTSLEYLQRVTLPQLKRSVKSMVGRIP